jgi:hypothetical protein
MSTESLSKGLRYLRSLAFHLAVFAMFVLAFTQIFFDISIENFCILLVCFALGNIFAPFAKKGLRRLVGSGAA